MTARSRSGRDLRQRLRKGTLSTLEAQPRCDIGEILFRTTWDLYLRISG